jgi:hypothetical protein
MRFGPSTPTFGDQRPAGAAAAATTARRNLCVSRDRCSNSSRPAGRGGRPGPTATDSTDATPSGSSAVSSPASERELDIVRRRRRARSLTLNDLVYRHLTRDSHDRAIAPLDGGVDAGGRFVDAVAPATSARNASKPPVAAPSEQTLCRTRTGDPFLTTAVCLVRSRPRQAPECLQERPNQHSADDRSGRHHSARSVAHWLPGRRRRSCTARTLRATTLAFVRVATMEPPCS